MVYKLFFVLFLLIGTNINAFKFGNFKGTTKRFASNLFYPQNDMKELHYLQTSAISDIWLNKIHEKYNSYNHIDKKIIKDIDKVKNDIKNDIHKNYLAFVPHLIDDNECSETLSILVYSIFNQAKNDKVIYVDTLIISPYWEESQITLNSIKNAYCRYFKEQLNIKYVYLL